MANSKILIIALPLVLLYSVSWAQNDPNVVVKKAGDRQEAVVSGSSTGPKKTLPDRSLNGYLDKRAAPVGDGILSAAKVSSAAIGKGTDLTVAALQTGTGFVLSPVFRAVDIRRKIDERQKENSKETS